MLRTKDRLHAPPVIRPLLAHKISQHPFVATPANRQREFFTIEMNYLAAPTAFNRSILLRHNFFVIGRGIFYLDKCHYWLLPVDFFSQAARFRFFSIKISRTNQEGIDQVLPPGSRRNITRR